MLSHRKSFLLYIEPPGIQVPCRGRCYTPEHDGAGVSEDFSPAGRSLLTASRGPDPPMCFFTSSHVVDSHSMRLTSLTASKGGSWNTGRQVMCQSVASISDRAGMLHNYVVPV